MHAAAGEHATARPREYPQRFLSRRFLSDMFLSERLSLVVSLLQAHTPITLGGLGGGRGGSRGEGGRLGGRLGGSAQATTRAWRHVPEDAAHAHLLARRRVRLVIDARGLRFAGVIALLDRVARSVVLHHEVAARLRCALGHVRSAQTHARTSGPRARINHGVACAACAALMCGRERKGMLQHGWQIAACVVSANQEAA